MKLKPHQRVTLEEAKERALKVLNYHPLNASFIADVIWPDHAMHAQGAGAAASRVLKVLEKEGKARWACTRYSWGWVRQ